MQTIYLIANIILEQHTISIIEYNRMQSRTQSQPPKPKQPAESRGIKMKRKPMFDQSGQNLLNGIRLSFEKGFGYNQNPELRNNAHCIDDNRIIYILASQIVLYDMLAETQRVIESFDWEEEVGAMTYFKSIMLEDNIVYGLHNSNKSFPSLVVLNFSKNSNQKIMLANLEKEEKITDIVLVNDLRNVVTISRVDKIVRLSLIEIVSKEIKVSEYLSFCPTGVHSLAQFPSKIVLNTPTEIYVSDIDEGLKMYPLSVRKWFQLDKQQTITQIACSLHIEFCIYAITDKGNLYFIYIDMKQHKITKVDRYFLGEFKTLNQRGSEITARKRPSSICVNEYNIAIGYELIEQFTLVKICAVASQPPTIETIKFSCPALHKIVRMSFAVETMAICVVVQVKENDRYDFSIPIESQFLKDKAENKGRVGTLATHLMKPGKMYPVVFNLLLYDTLVETLRSPIQSVLNSLLLVKKIIDLCVIPTKKLIIILSAEKKIKAIKYQHVTSISFNKMLAWETTFNPADNPTSFDVHPLTFNVAVGFKQGVKLFNIFSDGMKTTNILFPLKNCQCVKYSRFGHLLIAGSNNQILLINPYQNKINNTIQLSHGYLAREISLIDRDMYLFGNFANGSSQVMTLEGNKIFEVWNKSVKCVCSCYDPIFDIMVVSYEDNQVKFYRERGEIEFAIMWTYPFLITRILIVNELGTAFLGTSQGKIRAYQWPFTDMMKFNKSYTEIQLHRAPISQIKITHDYSYLISGAEDGTVFMSKIIPYSDGMIVSDSSALHSFKVNKKNYTSLYYMQNFMCTNNSIECEKEEEIVQYESDKVDSSSEYTFVLQAKQIELEKAVAEYDVREKDDLRKEIQPLEDEVEDINKKKVELKEQLEKFLRDWEKQTAGMEEKKLNTMRELYKESDHLKLRLAFYTKQCAQEIEAKKEAYSKELNGFRAEMQAKERVLMSDCSELEKQFSDSLVNYKALIKEEEEEGQIYKSKMMEQLESELQFAKNWGEDLRKKCNKICHDIQTEEEKGKYFHQMSSELNVDIEISKTKKQGLLKQITQLGEMLKAKDKQIFNEEKAVKELLKKSINNYSHEEYLKHKQEELIEKAKYLETEIMALDEKYRQFQDNFIDASKETNDYVAKIQEAIHRIESLKQKQKAAKQKSYMRRYKDKETYSKVVDEFHQCASKAAFSQKIKKVLQLHDSLENEGKEHSVEVQIQKRDHLIDQVVNTNKLRKIDDTIRKTIMIKLNRETVNLTSEVNELRKQKKGLTTKMRDIQNSIRQAKGIPPEKQNKDLSSLTDIVPANISIIQSQTSKHVRPLPFQVYHQTKNIQRGSTYSKANNSKSINEESTQLPSIIKNNQSNSGSFLEQSSLFGVQEYEDQIAM